MLFLKKLPCYFKKILILSLAVFGVVSSTTISANISEPGLVIDRVDVIREKLLKNQQEREKSNSVIQLSQMWPNWPNWPNWQNWQNFPNYWRNF